MKQKLWNRDFTLVVIGQIISLFGNAILRFALPLYLLRETGSAALFGMVTACSFLPMIVLSFLGGILADRVNKRNIMVILDFSTAAIVLVFLLVLGKLPIVPLFILVLMLLYGISGAYQPAVQASIPALVSGEQILPAGAVVNQVASLAGLLGPIVGGILFGAFGIVPILVISILCFFASAVMEIFIRIPYTKRQGGMSVSAILKSDFRDSLHYIRHEKPILLRIICILAAFNLVMSAMIIVGTPVLIVGTLGLSDAHLGFAQGALAFGGLCGGILTAVFSKRLRFANSHLLLLLCSVFVGVMALPLLLQLGTQVCYLTITVASFVMMALATMFTVQMFAAVQTETPPELVGKVIALMMSIAMCSQPVGQAIYGLVFERFAAHTGNILLVSCVLSVVVSLISRKVFCAVDAADGSKDHALEEPVVK